MYGGAIKLMVFIPKQMSPYVQTHDLGSWDTAYSRVEDFINLLALVFL